MANFDYRKALKENKATFFSSLTEGQFSWFTQDTEEQIGSERENTLPFVYMHDDKGNKWLEKNYEGYGEFGGKDYYELLDQMNGGIGDRSEGIRKAFDAQAVANGEIKFPALTVSATLPNGHDFTEEAEHDPNQSWYTPEEEEDDYGYGFGDMDREEDYDEEEIDEAIMPKFDVETTTKIAQQVADAFTAKDDLDLKYVVSPDVEESSFNLDVEAGPNTPGDDWKDVNGFGIENYLGKYAGGSFYIKDGVVINAAARGAKVANVSDEGEVEMISADDSGADLDAKEKANVFVREGDLISNIGKGLDYEATLDKIKDYADRLLGADVEDVEDLMDFYLDNPADLPEPLEYNFFKNNYDDILYYATTGKDELGEGKVENKSNKMKKSELKEMIKAALMNEVTLDIDNMEDTHGEEDFLAEVEAILAEADEVKEGVWSVLPARIPEFINAIEALKDEYHGIVGSDDVYNGLDAAISAAEELLMNTAEINEADEEVVDDTEVAVGDEENIDVDMTAKVDPNVKAVQDSLTQAQAAAQKLGDAKLTDQIGNTITFFTRQHVAGTDKGAVAEADEMEEGKKEYYKDAEADDAEHIKALEKDMKDDKKSSEKLQEAMFPMLKKILK